MKESKINHEEEKGETIPGFEGRIEFKNCHFYYPTRPDVTVIICSFTFVEAFVEIWSRSEIFHRFAQKFACSVSSK